MFVWPYAAVEASKGRTRQGFFKLETDFRELLKGEVCCSDVFFREFKGPWFKVQVIIRDKNHVIYCMKIF